MIAVQDIGAETRHTVQVQVANLTELEKELLHTTIAVLTDPGLTGARQAMLDGKLALAVEDGEVVWIDPRGEEGFSA